jgi:selenide, water dikinase
LVGSETCDDAGVYRLDATTALIQTVDFFTPIVDDPSDFGRIAAANALSDVYAMGGRPLLCMNILCCPVKTMDSSMFRRVVEGGLAMIREAGALLVGGHSIEDPELKYGLAVTGLVHPDQVLLNSGAQAGNVLLLTKPLGTGILATALKGGLAGGETERRMVALMATLNRMPMEILSGDQGLRSGVCGCTDITGFGLLGHLHEMAEASGVSIHIDRNQLPIVIGARDFADMGIIPEGAYRNRTHYRQWVRSSLPEMDTLEMIGYDPQTSGGLLLALHAETATKLLAALRQQGYGPECRIIGDVRASDPGLVFIG